MSDASDDLLSPSFDPTAWLDARMKEPRSPEYERLLLEVVASQEARRKRYEAASPEERERMDAEVIEAGARFICDTDFGGP